MSEHKHTNRLANETSPYLLQHAHNPVDWHPWGEEALASAREQNKPILLSIGYSACHWCHVMERESFENEDIASLMNENFINIKVDREERPDLDQIYMNAVQMMTGQGGWPMTMFLTPEGVPFYGGTYFPPDDRHNMPGFPRVLAGAAEAYRARPDDVTKTAVTLLGELRRFGLQQTSDDVLAIDLLDGAESGLARSYDTRYGGFGSAPKFPAAMNLEFLLRQHHRTGDVKALAMVEHTCRMMAEGGMYDQLGGGFHRYSTDQRWLVPHFEKMLYDNALLSRLYLHVYQQTRDEFYRRIAEETLDYVAREMTNELGGFYSTQDADSEGHEGKFFVWNPEEIQSVLGADDARLFNEYYDVTDKGNFEGKSILNINDSIEVVAKKLGLSSRELEGVLKRSRHKLFLTRETRIKPDRDEKVLTSWNGLMLAGFAEAGAILDRQDYLLIAKKNAEFILNEMLRDGLLLRTYRDGRAKLNAYLEDYAFYSDGLVTLYQATGEFRWLESAVSLVDRMIEEFWDQEDGGFFYTGNSHETLIVRTKDYFDNATPSGNSVAAEVLLHLATITGNESYKRTSVALLRMLSSSIRRYPSAFGRALCVLDFYLSKPREICIVGDASSPDTLALSREVWKRFLPNKVVVQSADVDIGTAKTLPLLQNRIMINNRATGYVCENYVCKSPVNTPEDLALQLAQSTNS